MQRLDCDAIQAEGVGSDGDSIPFGCATASVAAVAMTAGRLLDQLEVYALELRTVNAARLEGQRIVAELRIAVQGTNAAAERLDCRMLALAAEGAAHAAEKRFSDAATSMAAAAGAQALRDSWRKLLKRAAAALEEEEHEWHSFLADNEQVTV